VRGLLPGPVPEENEAHLGAKYGRSKGRRRYERLNVALSAYGTCFEGDACSYSFSGLTKDVAARGVCLVLQEPGDLKVGQQCDLRVEFVPGEEPIRAHALIRWHNPPQKEGEPSLMGIELTGIRTVQDYERWLEFLAWHEQWSRPRPDRRKLATL